MRNCRRVHLTTPSGATQHLETGWVGVDKGEMLFRPTRGSSGYALYGSKASALRQTGASEAIEVTLKLLIEDDDEPN